jgi:hypothetical protein
MVDCIIRTIVTNQRQGIFHNTATVNWSSKVCLLLQNAGLCDVCEFPESVDIDLFITVFIYRLRDIYMTNWHASVQTFSSLFFVWT